MVAIGFCETLAANHRFAQSSRCWTSPPVSVQFLFLVRVTLYHEDGSRNLLRNMSNKLFDFTFKETGILTLSAVRTSKSHRQTVQFCNWQPEQVTSGGNAAYLYSESNLLESRPGHRLSEEFHSFSRSLSRSIAG
jgi:hypothetical protein